jgi:hypothetical protein
MTDSTIIDIQPRLRDRRDTEADRECKRVLYEYLDEISQDLGSDYAPHEVFPIIVRVMIEWAEATRGIDGEIDLQTARALANAITALSAEIRRFAS